MGPSLKQDENYVKEHLGAWSHRRSARGGYSNDDRGRYTYRGEPVNNGGYVDGRLRDAQKERLEFGPGEAWNDERDGEPGAPEVRAPTQPSGVVGSDVPENEMSEREKRALFDDT